MNSLILAGISGASAACPSEVNNSFEGSNPLSLIMVAEMIPEARTLPFFSNFWIR